MAIVTSIEGFDYKLQVVLQGRACSSEEANMASKFCDEFVRLLRRNDLLASSEVRDRIAETEKSIRALFVGRAIYVEKISNDYSPDSVFPWYVVTTDKGRIKLGWRKRVIQIDWSDSEIDLYSNLVFGGEDVTTGEKWVHAWGYEKAAYYLKVLLS